MQLNFSDCAFSIEKYFKVVIIVYAVDERKVGQLLKGTKYVKIEIDSVFK